MRENDSQTSRVFNFFLSSPDYCFKALVIFILIAMLMGVAKMFVDLWEVVIAQSLEKAFDTILTDILTMFVVLELFKSILDYFEHKRLKLTLIVDASLIFVVREVMIGLFEKELEPAKIVALSLLLFVLGAIRTLAVVYSPKKYAKIFKERRAL